MWQIEVLGKSFQKKLLEDIPAEFVPAEYGGKCDTCHPSGKCVHVTDIAPLRTGYVSYTENTTRQTRACIESVSDMICLSAVATRLSFVCNTQRLRKRWCLLVMFWSIV